MPERERTNSGENRHHDRPDQHWTFTRWAKQKSQVLVVPVARLLYHFGLRPNALSIAGLILASAAGIAAAAGHLLLAGWLFLFSGPFDVLDGALARTAGTDSRFGAFLDSFLDRYADAAILIGLVYWASRHDQHSLAVVSALALLGSVMVSYARARAEGLNTPCYVGLLTRPERFILLVLTLFTGQLLLGLSLLAILSNLTALQRLRHVYLQIGKN